LKRLIELSKKRKNERGSLLINTLVATAILAVIGTTILTALATTSKAVHITDERDTAMNLALSQLEFVKDQPWAAQYTPAPIPSEYNGYSTTINVENITQRDSNIQKIMVTVEHQNKEVVTLEGYKVNR
jgi:type II secretory pathway pseudopilin PulG